MDSEDEEFMDKIEKELASEHGWLGDMFQLNGPDMRINHNREREMLRTIAPLLSEEQNTAAESFSRYRPLFTRYRISRFFRTLQGFHTGCLDLTGRHQARYKSLLKRWGDFSRDLAQVINVFLAPIPTHSDTWDEDDDDDLLSLPIQPGSEDLLHAFGKKWRLEATSKSAMQHVLMLFEQLATTLEQSPLPVFQKMRLTDLPSELLHIILSSADQHGARLLGSTCKLLRDTSRSYIYRDRTLSFKSVAWANFPEDADKGQIALDGVLVAKDRLLGQMRSMLDSNDPRLLQDIESLWVGGVFHRDTLVLAGIEEDFETRRQYYEPLLEALLMIVVKAVNTEKLTINQWDLSAEIVPAVLSLPHLHTLIIRDCRIWPGPIHHPSSPILNAHITVNDDEDLAAWAFFAGMPQLRVLSICSASQAGSPLCPPPAIRTVINPFKTVERFVISKSSHEETSELIEWLRLARQAIGRLRLTHFKFDGGPDGIAEVPLFDLLHVLRGSPMLRLSFDGIYEAEPDLLQTIGQYFPRLESLALHYRQSYRQTRNEPARWPAPSWEYAATLRAFPHLKHFVWNQWTNVYEAQTRILEVMERDWQDMAPQEMMEATSNYDDWDCVARLFAVYGSSLETFTYASRLPEHHYTIARTTAGICVSSEADAFSSRWKFIRELDPFDFPTSWPYVYTPAPDPSSQ